MMNKDSNNQRTSDLLINKAGEGKYCQEDAIRNLIRYIARKNGLPKDDLVCCGAFGATDFTDIDDTVRQFECVQLLHKRKGRIDRYVDHEVYSFSMEDENNLKKYNGSLDVIARKMANEFFKDGFQVYYGVHHKDKGTGHLHIHFAVNTVNYKTGKKRHENMAKTKRNEQKFRDIVNEEIRNQKERLSK